MKTKMRKHCIAIAIFSYCLVGHVAERGVTEDTIFVGQVSDLSGATAFWGVPYTNGGRVRIDEVNAAGGIHGRKIEFIVEDGQYQVPVSIKAANKLLNRDKVFVMYGNIGTPANNANMPRQFRMGVPNLFPMSAAATMYDPLHPMKFSYFVSYGDQISGAVRYFSKKLGIKKVCMQTQATDYGYESELGYERAVEALGLESVYLGRHKITETDFVGTVTRLRNSDCEALFIGTLITDTIQLYTTAREAGWDKPIVGNIVPLHPLISAAADGGMEGLYSAGTDVMTDLTDETDEGKWRREWHERYRERFGSEANIQGQIGYVTADLMIRAMEAAGRDLTVQKMLTELEKIKDYEHPFDGPTLSFGPEKHWGSDALTLSQVIDGTWTVVEKNLPY